VIDPKAMPTHALTLWQPWASAIVHGPKRVENRSWSPPGNVIGRRIWIHAGMYIDHEHYEDVIDLWRMFGVREATIPKMVHGAIIGHAIVAGYGYERAADDGALLTDPEYTVVGAVTSDVFDDPWWMGPYGWVLCDVREIQPVEVRGFQKLWRIKNEHLQLELAREFGRSMEAK